MARRTLFESSADIRFFLSRLARQVRAGRVEIHAYCVLTTHFHMLVRSPTGELSGVMQSVQNEYSRWFNRSRRRDGPLYRSRFLSKPVRSECYRRLLVRYIDANPVAAGLVTAPVSYPHGSARRYVLERGPAWLERKWVESVVRVRCGLETYDAARYSESFGASAGPDAFALVERRSQLPGDDEDPLDDLLAGAAGRVRDWMARKAALADGTSIGLPVCDVTSLEAAIDEARRDAGAWEVTLVKRTIDAWPIVRVGLMRALCGSTLVEAGARTGRTAASAWVLEDRHQRLMRDAPRYAERATEMANAAIVRCHRGVAHTRSR